MEFGEARLVGFLEHGRDLSPHERDSLLELYGPCPLTILRSGSTLRAIRVITTPIKGGQPLRHHLRGLELKRRGLWRNPVRNRRISRLVEALVSDNNGRLSTDYPSVAEASDGRVCGRVLVLAESMEHAALLSRQLPEAPIVSAPKSDAPSGGVPHAGEVGLTIEITWDDAPDPEFADVVIATPFGLKQLDLRCFDVLVRSDGGTGLPPGMTTHSLQITGDIPELLVIDFHDRHHPTLRNRSDARLRAYAEAGWAIGAHDRNGLAPFLMTRPGGKP